MSPVGRGWEWVTMQVDNRAEPLGAGQHAGAGLWLGPLCPLHKQHLQLWVPEAQCELAEGEKWGEDSRCPRQGSFLPLRP